MRSLVIQGCITSVVRWLDNERRRGKNEQLCDFIECCGIVGYCGDKEASPILLNGVELLQNRGYDSCGVATLDKKKLFVTKFASRGTTSDSVAKLLEAAPARHLGHNIGIAHTRWATHGGKSDDNAHPHMDWKERIALVHNGTIVNYDVLKKELEAYGCVFKSQTDSEVIANLIGFYLDKGYKFQDAVTKAVNRLRGTWGLVVLHRDSPNGLMCARNGSPLIIGSAPNQIIIASEPLALAQHTNEYLSLNDGDVVFVSRDRGLQQLERGRDKREIPKQDLETTPSPFQHWTIREIYEQPQSLARALNFGARVDNRDPNHPTVKLGGLDHDKTRLLGIKNLLITGCGTSLHAGLFGEYLFRRLGCFEGLNVIDSSEVTPAHFTKPSHKCGILALSQSGETRDVVEALEEAGRQDATKFSIVNQVGSLIARMTGCGVYLNAGREVAVASTKAFTGQVVVLSLIAAWFAINRSKHGHDNNAAELLQAVMKVPHFTTELLGLDTQCKRIAGQLKNARSIFVLGKGAAYPVALEGALKIKEISYIHAEGFAGGQLKHGPFALIDGQSRTPVILIILRDSNQDSMINALEQVKARGARVIAITDDPDTIGNKADEVITIPNNGLLTGLNSTVPLQLLAYHLAIARGVNPDKPRGLAKTVTVA